MQRRRGVLLREWEAAALGQGDEAQHLGKAVARQALALARNHLGRLDQLPDLWREVCKAVGLSARQYGPAGAAAGTQTASKRTAGRCHSCGLCALHPTAVGLPLRLPRGPRSSCLAEVGGREARGEEEVPRLAVGHPPIAVGVRPRKPGIHRDVGHAINRLHFCWGSRRCCWGGHAGRAAAGAHGCRPPPPRQLGGQQVLHGGNKSGR